MKRGKTGIIVQARMSSTRLPGKVLREILGKSILEYQIERLNRVEFSDQLIVATSTDPSDDPITDLCKTLEVPVFRGPLEDVLARYFLTAQHHQLETIVRITSDCPLIDPPIVDEVVRRYNSDSALDYVSNNFERSYPRGLDTEVFSMRALQKAFTNASLAPEREHVTYFIYTHPELFQLATVRCPKDLQNHRWTVDTVEDFELISKIITEIYPRKPNFTLPDVLALLDQHPDWIKINQQIQQKPVLGSQNAIPFR